jgi:lysozyme
LAGSGPAPANPQPLPAAPTGGRELGEAGIKLIQYYEHCETRLPDGRFQAYPDPGSKDGRPWTIGWGSTGPDVTPGTIWTQEQCDERFTRDLGRYAAEVSRALGDSPTTQNQFDALVSFHYNTGAIAKATLTQRHKAGDYAGAREAFAWWNKNDGKVMRGLVLRRKAEADLYAKP